VLRCPHGGRLPHLPHHHDPRSSRAASSAASALPQSGVSALAEPIPACTGRATALPHHAFGLDGLTCIGARRSASHRRVPDIQQALGERGGGPERPGRSPSSGSALRHWSPSPATPRRVSGVLRRRQGVASWPSMACNPRWARKSSGASALVSRARCAWPVAYGPPRTPTEPRCSARASRPWQGPVRAS
jgi:hypothetical protein